MTWRLSDLPVETRLAAENAASAQGRTLEAWLVETVRCSLAGGDAFRQADPSTPSAAPPRHDAAPPLAPEVSWSSSAPRPDPWQLLRARLLQMPPKPETADENPAGPARGVVLPLEPRANAHPSLPTADPGPASTAVPLGAVQSDTRPALPSGPITSLPLTALTPPRNRLRRAGDGHEVAALAIEIAAQGVRDPVLVRRAQHAGTYEIVVGERRRLAAQRAGKAEILAIIIDADDGEALLLSLSENLAHSDLTPLDEARGYLRLLTEFRLNPSALAKRLALERAHIASTLRLLGLPPRVRQLIENGRIGGDQAFRLLEATDPEAAAERLLASPVPNASGE